MWWPPDLGTRRVPLCQARGGDASERAVEPCLGKLSDVKSGGTGLATFIQKQIDGDSSWASVTP